MRKSSGRGYKTGREGGGGGGGGGLYYDRVPFCIAEFFWGLISLSLYVHVDINKQKWENTVVAVKCNIQYSFIDLCLYRCTVDFTKNEKCGR